MKKPVPRGDTGSNQRRPRSGGELAQHIGQDTARIEILQFLFGIDAAQGFETAVAAIGTGKVHRQHLAWLQAGHTGDVKDFGTVEPGSLAVRPCGEL